MTPVTGAFSATGPSSAISLSPFFANLNEGLTYYKVTLWGTFTATVRVEVSFDGDLWHPLSKDLDGSAIELTTPICIPLREADPKVQYRLNCTSYSSGPVNYRLSCR